MNLIKFIFKFFLTSIMLILLAFIVNKYKNKHFYDFEIYHIPHYIAFPINPTSGGIDWTNSHYHFFISSFELKKIVLGLKKTKKTKERMLIRTKIINNKTGDIILVGFGEKKQIVEFNGYSIENNYQVYEKILFFLDKMIQEKNIQKTWLYKLKTDE